MSGEDLATVVRVVGSLAVVLVLVAVAARIARRARVGSGDSLRIVERVGLSREAYLAIVEAGGRTLLVGVTSQGGVSMLAPLDGQVRPTPPIHVVLEPGARATPAPAAPAAPAAAPAAPAGAAPAPAAPPEAGAGAAPGVRMPAGLDLEGHADLASALRAAGRTTDEEPAAPAAAGQPAGEEQPGAAPAVPAGAGQQPLPRRAEVRGRRGRPPVPQQRQASGSPLSPATWRQGIDAIRDYTVRRG